MLRRPLAQPVARCRRTLADTGSRWHTHEAPITTLIQGCTPEQGWPRPAWYLEGTSWPWHRSDAQLWRCRGDESARLLESEAHWRVSLLERIAGCRVRPAGG